MSSVITSSILTQTISWDDYYAIATKYVEADNKPELYQNPKMLKYTAENLKRIEHVLQTINIQPKLYNALAAITTKLIWVVLTEPWCGDASQEVPALYSIASCTGKISFRIIESDSHPEIMDAYLTGESRSIPKLICLHADTLEELGTWGPRPAVLQKIVMENKDNPNLTFGDKVRMIHSWYEADKTFSIQDEFIDLVKQWTK